MTANLDIKNALHQLIQTAETHSSTKIGQLRIHYDEIERALKAGVPRETILKTLNEKGINMSFVTFASSLQRVRNERKAAETDATIPV